MKRWIIVITALMFASWVLAEDVSFQAVAPTTVVVGERFRVSYTINKKSKDFRAPEMTDFNVLMGPSTSQSQSTQIINGNITTSMSISYTFVLVGMNPGTYTLGAATVMVGNEKYSSNVLHIQVLPPDDPAAAQAAATKQASAHTNQSAQQPSGAETVNGDNIFVRQIFSKSNVFEQEAVLVTFKLYTRYDVRDITSVKFPEYKGFYVQDIDLNPDQQFTVEHYNGLNYNTYVLKQCLIYPQHSGTLAIEEGSLDAVLRVRTSASRRSQSIFDNFFDTYQEVRKTMRIPSSKIEVKPLPKPAPASFTGAVGNYKLNSSLSSTSVKANDALTLKLSISGTGNIKLLKNPEISFPQDFDVYDPKVEDNTKVSTAGVSGTRNIEYVVIPRFGGDFEIQPTEFTYFDLKAQQYKTLNTPLYNIHAEGESAEATTTVSTPVVGSNQEKIKTLGTDIRYIHSGAMLKKRSSAFVGSALYWCCYMVPLLLTILLVVLLRQKARDNANVALRRTKGANKQARKRLRVAARALKENDKSRFYEETLKALWGYLGDKLSIPLASLTKDSATAALRQRAVDEALIDECLQALSDCEYARFAPVLDESMSMPVLYDRAAAVITKFENVL